MMLTMMMMQMMQISYLVRSGDLGTVVYQFSDNLCMPSASGPCQARHVMLSCHGNSSSSSNNNNNKICLRFRCHR